MYLSSDKSFVALSWGLLMYQMNITWLLHRILATPRPELSEKFVLCQ